LTIEELSVVNSIQFNSIQFNYNCAACSLSLASFRNKVALQLLFALPLTQFQLEIYYLVELTKCS